MQIPKIEPKIAAMPGFRIMREYNAWEMLASVFGNCNLNIMRDDFWEMYKSAIMEKEGLGKKVRRRRLTCLFETLNDLATAAYILYEWKDYKLYFEVDAVAAFFPMWERLEADPYDVLFKIFTDFGLDELRNQLWELYKAAIVNNNTYHGRREKYEMIFLFERLNDLVTAAYVITIEKYQSNLKQ